MIDSDDSILEQRLRQTTQWPHEEPSPALWQRALDAHLSKRGVHALGYRMLAWPLPLSLAAAIMIVLIGVVATSLFMSERLEQTASKAVPVASAPAEQFWNVGLLDEQHSLDRRVPGQESEGGIGGGGAGGRKLRAPASLLSNTPSQDSHENRSVIRRATVELTTSDVRAAMLKAMHMVSEASGEYVQESSIVGEGQTAQANLTIRVAVHRLSAVLNELRELGAVHTEKLGGEDVTEQIVDLDARLRNELRVEQELLGLLEKRQDAPLKDILELRTHIATVRHSVERLVAQRERLDRLVALATVLVIIRPDLQNPKPSDEKESNIAAYFSDVVAQSWSSGLLFLADTIGRAVRLIVGGLVWWMILIIALLSLRQHLQRRAVEGR